MSVSGNTQKPWYRNPLFWIVVAVYTLFVVYQLLPGGFGFSNSLPIAGALMELEWPWGDIGLGDRGDFVAGFFAPLALIAAVGAVFLQQRSLNAQREETQQQTEIFRNELLHQKRNEWRSDLRDLDARLEDHARILRKQIEKKRNLNGKTGSTLSDVEECNKRLQSIFNFKKDSDFLRYMDSESRKKFVDSVCYYVSRLDDFMDRAESCGLTQEFIDFKFYTPYGKLYNTCKSYVLPEFVRNEYVVGGKSWEYSVEGALWVLKRSHVLKRSTARDIQEVR